MPEDVEDSRDETKQNISSGGSLKLSSGFWQLVFKVIELILCLICFGLAMYLVTAGRAQIGVFLTLFCILLFIFITLVDIIVITVWFPIGWRAWILISLSASLFFFTCTGLSFLVYHSLFFLGTIFFLITAIVFLLDSLCIIWLVQGVEDTGRPCSSTVCKASQIVPMNRQPDQRKSSGSAVAPVKIYIQEQDQECGHQSQQTQYTASSRSEPKCHRWQPPNKTTYGGTFHMSKDTTPLPTPKSIGNTMSDFEEHDTHTTIEEEPTKKVRTVGVMTRMVPRYCQKQVDLTPLKSPFDTQPKRPPKRLRRVSFSSCREDGCKYDSTNSNSPRSCMASDTSSPRLNQQILSKSKV